MEATAAPARVENVVVLTNTTSQKEYQVGFLFFINFHSLHQYFCLFLQVYLLFYLCFISLRNYEHFHIYP
jgi:hypothetical protein